MKAKRNTLVAACLTITLLGLSQSCQLSQTQPNDALQAETYIANVGTVT